MLFRERMRVERERMHSKLGPVHPFAAWFALVYPTGRPEQARMIVLADTETAPPLPCNPIRQTVVVRREPRDSTRVATDRRGSGETDLSGLDDLVPSPAGRTLPLFAGEDFQEDE